MVYLQHNFLIHSLIFCGRGSCCAGSSLVHRLVSSGEQGILPSCGAWVSHRRGFSPARGSGGFSSGGTWAPQHRLDSCGARAQLLCYMWDLLRSGIKLMSPTMRGEFFTSELPGKALLVFYFKFFVYISSHLIVLIC